MANWRRQTRGGVLATYGGPATAVVPGRRTNRTQSRTYWRERYASRYVTNLMFAGGQCAHCGIDDMRVLQFDHKTACGNTSARRLRTDSVELLGKLLSDQDEYQLLCANCNWIKRCENSETTRRKEA